MKRRVAAFSLFANHIAVTKSFWANGNADKMMRQLAPQSAKRKESAMNGHTTTRAWADMPCENACEAPHGRCGHACAIYKDTLYVFGGM